jgi:hypothetical protein
MVGTIGDGILGVWHLGDGTHGDGTDHGDGILGDGMLVSTTLFGIEVFTDMVHSFMDMVTEITIMDTLTMVYTLEEVFLIMLEEEDLY